MAQSLGQRSIPGSLDRFPTRTMPIGRWSRVRPGFGHACDPLNVTPQREHALRARTCVCLIN